MTGMEKVPGWNSPAVRRGVMTYVLIRRGNQWKISAVDNTGVVDVTMPKLAPVASFRPDRLKKQLAC